MSQPRNDYQSIYYRDAAETLSYDDLLAEIQQIVTDQHANVLSDYDPQTTSRMLHNIIEQWLIDEQYSLADMTREELVERLYDDMAGYSFLKKWIYKPGVEEVNINAYDDIEVIYSGGRSEKIPDKFESPQQAIDILRRMLTSCGMIIDDAMPSVLGSLDTNIRIEADIFPLVDYDVGVNASIRIVQQDTVSKEKLLRSGSVTEEMLNFLSVCVRYGVSVCIAGGTGSGKTTLMGWMLSNVPDDRRLITIEEGSRELNLIKRDENGNKLNSVCHLLTRPSENPAMNIDQDFLLQRVLRKNPSFIGMGEIRGTEVMAVAEAARTGKPTTTTIHSNSALDTYGRMMTLARRKYDMSDAALLRVFIEAFPIVVYVKQLEDGSRRTMEIFEAEKVVDDRVVGRTLWRYDIEDTLTDEETGKKRVVGKHVRVEDMSAELRRQFLNNGMPEALLNTLVRGVG